MTTCLQSTQGQAWRGYMAIEDLNLNTQQRQTLIAFLRALGPQAHFLSDHFNHWRTRPDGRAAIFEAQFNADRLSVAAFKTRLAAVFNIAPDTIDHTLNLHTFHTITTPILTFSRAATPYLRVACFAGLSSTWTESHREARAYLADNRADWDTPLEDGP